MESAALRRQPPLAGPIQAGLIALLVTIAAASWALTGDRMTGMDMGPGTDLGDFGWFLGVWVTMMAAMMFPSLAPTVVAQARIRDGAATALFVAGYLLAWAAIGSLGYLIVEGARSVDLGFLGWDGGGRYVAAGVIAAAAIYQLTPLKDVCLRHCREPETFLRRHGRPGRLGALRTGIEHGGYCVGCCWALMAALFALGVMSLGWMALVAALIATEKLLPWRRPANRGVALVLVVLGIAVALAPGEVPGLTVPGSPDQGGAMDSMGGPGSMEMGGGRSMER